MDTYEIGAEDLAALEQQFGVSGDSDAATIIGAIKAAQKGGSPARVSIRSSVSKSGMKRCWALPLDAVNLAAVLGSTQIIRGTANRPCKPIALVIALTTPATTIGVSGITIQGQNQMLGAGTVPASIYTAGSFIYPNNYDTIDTNGGVEVALVNATAILTAGLACFICEAVN